MNVPNTVIIANARVVTETSEFNGAIEIEGSTIRSVDDIRPARSATIDFEGDYVLPGLVDLHTDNIERHFFPRPLVTWPSAIDAIFAHDLQLAGAGVTTVFDALSLGDYGSGGARKAILASAVEAISRAKTSGLLRAEHLLHFRCEVSDEALMEIVEPHLAHPDLKLLSVMDHTPGQRQWRDLEMFRRYRRQKAGEVWTDEEFARHIEDRRRVQVEIAPAARRLIRDAAISSGIPLASHDDTTCEDIDESHADGVSICEFPTTLEAARRARELGMGVIMGAPNIVLGGSHSGNVAAAALAEEGLLDILTSDYVPTGLLHSAFVLAGRTMSLPAAIATVSATPAEFAGLPDRGRIAPGLKADLLRVRIIDGVPVVREVWRDGQPIIR